MVEVFSHKIRSRAIPYSLLWAAVCLWSIAIMIREARLDLTFTPFALFWLLVLGYNSVFIYRLVFLSRLEISSSGITYHDVRYIVSAPWARVTGVRTRRILGIRRLQELQLEAPSVKRNWWFDFAAIPFFNRRISIPLGPRLWEREVDLLNRIRQYAPAIFPAA